MTGPQDPPWRWRPPPPYQQPAPPYRRPQPPPWPTPYPPYYRPPPGPPPGWYGAPRPYAQPPPNSVAQQPKSSRVALMTLALLVAVAVAVVVIAVGVSRLDLFGGRQLDVRRTEAAVRQILTDPAYGYGVENVGDLRCNGGKNPSVKTGATFTCVVVVDGARRRVAVLMTDNNGTYEVDRPR